MSLDPLLQSIASSSQSIIRNAKAYDLSLQHVSSLLPGPVVSKLNNSILIFMSTGFMERYGSISSAFTAQPMSFDVDWNRCILLKSTSIFPHCAAVQAFVVDVSVIASIGVFTLLVVTRIACSHVVPDMASDTISMHIIIDLLLHIAVVPHVTTAFNLTVSQVALIALCRVNNVIMPFMRGSGEELILEDDEVILELHMSSPVASVAKPKRSPSTPSALPYTVVLSIFMVCGFGALLIALYAQIMVIPDAGGVWEKMSFSSGVPPSLKILTSIHQLTSSTLHQTVFRRLTFAVSWRSINLFSILPDF